MDVATGNRMLGSIWRPSTAFHKFCERWPLSPETWTQCGFR